MIPSRAFANRTVAIFGLARTGLGAVRALVAGGTTVIAWDDNSNARDLGGQEGAQLMPWREWPWEDIAALILSPGVPLTHPKPHGVVEHANRARVRIIGDVELFAHEIRPDPAGTAKAPVIAVTGTNGKSTTTALVGHILTSCGFDAQIGGNIGRSVLELSPPSATTIYVLEMSSFQIDLAPGLTPDVGILSNLSPDHIDRHGTMENYAGIKARLMRQTAKDGQVVIGVDDAWSSAIFTQLSAAGGAQAHPVSVGKVLGRGIFVVDGTLYDAMGARAIKVMDMSAAARLPGSHNWQNAALAYGAVRPFISDSKAVAAAIASFPGLAHRMEDVGGGKPKEGGIESLSEFFPRVRKAYLIGEAAPQFARTLDGKAPYDMSGTLDVAVASAAADAAASQAGSPVVLLSPACASYDQFKDFEQRGDVFRSLVAKLPRTTENPKVA
ncbi:MAG: UDP-N-acetylmuramoyl-L-alanine--D-glutamate ligase [Alphaproteobacteria bacterium]|nr:UDP-N-acetylmuramoyl-L-alanine--D-glutamate ligase [Alphaproteobacteria bacterium]